MLELKPDRELYRETYRDIHIEVSRHWQDYHREVKEVWCFYLFLLKEQFPKELHDDLDQPVRISDYGSHMKPYANCLQSLEWHGGMTFYEVTKCAGPFTNIKAGCDYNHIWDDNRYYSAKSVMLDAKNCVDSLYVLYPNLIPTKQLWDEYRAPFNKAMEEKGKLIAAHGEEK